MEILGALAIPVNSQLPDLRSSDIRAIQRIGIQLTEADKLETLGRDFIKGAEKVLPADFLLWNLWTPAMDGLLGFAANHYLFCNAPARHGDVLVATIHHHPVIAAGDLDSAWLRPQRMSDYQAGAQFQTNPLYREVYRHLESRYQIAYNSAELDGANIVLSWNFLKRDFTDCEINLLHLLGRMVEVLSQGIEERRKLQAVWQTLAGCPGKVSEVADYKKPIQTHYGLILSGFVAGESREGSASFIKWRRDTLDRSLPHSVNGSVTKTHRSSCKPSQASGHRMQEFPRHRDPRERHHGMKLRKVRLYVGSELYGTAPTSLVSPVNFYSAPKSDFNYTNNRFSLHV